MKGKAFLLFCLTLPALAGNVPCPAAVARARHGFLDGAVFERTFDVVERSGRWVGRRATLRFRAVALVEGDTLRLADAEIADAAGGVLRPRWWRLERRVRAIDAGPSAIVRALERLRAMAREAGFRRLAIEGRRDTGARAERPRYAREIRMEIELDPLPESP